MWTAAFFSALLERAVKTFAQALGALLLADGTGIMDSDWGNNLSVAGMAALLSVLTTIASGGVTGTASITRAEIPASEVAVVKDAKTGDLLAADALTSVPNGHTVTVSP